MRTIKFRVWDKKKKTFSLKKGAYFIRSDGLVERQEMSMGGIDDNGVASYCSSNWPLYNYNNQYVIQQFTGLKDRNKREIYEGDIIHTSKNVLRKIIWDDDECAWYAIQHERDTVPFPVSNGLNRNYPEFEVRGNIFENPELLTK